MHINRNLITSAAICALLGVAVATRSEAQGGDGYGGGRHRGGDRGEQAGQQQKDNAADEVAKRFEDMSAAKPVMKDLELNDAAKDSINRIEKTYTERFRTYAVATRRQFEDAKAQGSTPDMEAIQKLHDDARTLQDQEYGEIRALVPADQQMKFDANVKQHHEDDDKQANEHRDRMRRERP
jgi:hypothetical protein